MEEHESVNIHCKRNVSDMFEPVLINVNNNDPTASIHIDKDQFNIGRGRPNDEIIADVSISRQHCVFKRLSDTEWTIQDVSSSGTSLNGVQLPPREARPIKIGDTVQLGPMPQFRYTFERSDTDGSPSAKRARMAAPDLDMSQIVMKQKTFEESQQLERDNLAEQMKAKHTEQLELKNELQKLLNDRDAALGEKDDLNRQINQLEKNIDDVKVAEMNLEKLNKELSERLDKERQEFEIKLNDEKKKMEEALELSKKEKELMANNMREQLEKLKNEQQIECQKLTESLSEEKKTAEKLQGEKDAYAQKLKEMEDALSKIEAKANELQNTLEQQNASKAVETGEVVGDVDLTILDTIDLTVETPVKKPEEPSGSDAGNEAILNKVGDIMDEQLTCSICSELFVIATTMNCTHTFCKDCIGTWMKKKKECPVCRTAITSTHRSLVLDNFIDKMVENLSDEYKKRRNEIVEERRETERLAKEAAKHTGGKKGRGRVRPPPYANPAAASSRTAGNNPRTERTDGIERPASNSRTNPERNNASSSSDQRQQQQQPATTGSTSAYQQTPAAAQGASNAAQQADNDASSTSTDADRDTASNTSSQSSDDPEGHLTDIDNMDFESDEHGTDNSWGVVDIYGDDEYWSDEQGEDYVEGIPGRVYGGYGACYNCGNRGHWAPGCPYR